MVPFSSIHNIRLFFIFMLIFFKLCTHKLPPQRRENVYNLVLLQDTLFPSSDFTTDRSELERAI